MKRDIYYLIALAAAVIVAFYFFNRSRTLSATIDRKDSIIAEKDAEIVYHKNEKGQAVAEKLAAQATTKEISKAYPQIVKELKDDFDIKIKDMKAYVQNQFKAVGSGNATVVHNHYDSAGKSYPVWQLKVNDGYLDFSADIIDSLRAPYQYSYVDTATTVISGRRKWLLASEKLYATTIFKNKNAQIQGATNILVDDYKDKRFVVYVGGGYDPFNNKMVISAGLGYALFKF